MSINKSYVLAGALVATSSIVMPIAETSQVEAATQTVTVTSRVNFRKGPSMNYSIMRKLYKGYKLTYFLHMLFSHYNLSLTNHLKLTILLHFSHKIISLILNS